MSIAFDRATTSNDDNDNTIQRSTTHFIHGGRHGLSAHNRSKGSTDLTAAAASSPMMDQGQNQREDDDDDNDEGSDSDDSSIGRNSDVSSVSSVDGDDDDDDRDVSEIEVQKRAVKKSPLDTMNDLYDVLPIRKGISMHYSGKSKSFTSLADAVSSTSIKEIVKPINPYIKKRKNDLLHGLKSHNQKLPPRVNSDGGIFRRMTNGDCSLGSSANNLNTETLSPPTCLPPRHPQFKISPINEPSSSFLSPRQNNLSYRSYSVSDLHNLVPGLVIDNRLT